MKSPANRHRWNVSGPFPYRASCNSSFIQAVIHSCCAPIFVCTCTIRIHLHIDDVQYPCGCVQSIILCSGSTQISLPSGAPRFLSLQVSGFWNSMASVIRRCMASSRSKGRFVAKMIMPGPVLPVLPAQPAHGDGFKAKTCGVSYQNKPEKPILCEDSGPSYIDECIFAPLATLALYLMCSENLGTACKTLHS